MLPAIRLELLDLLDSLCDQRMSDGESARLEAIVLADPQAQKLYLEYIHLHGTLVWDAGVIAAPLTTAASSLSQPVPAALTTSVPGQSATRPTRRTSKLQLITLATVALVLGIMANSWFQNFAPDLKQPLAGQIPNDPGSEPSDPSNFLPITPEVGVDVEPDQPELVANVPETPTIPEIHEPGPPTEVLAVVQQIDHYLKVGWQAGDVTPSPVAEDAEWLRRVYLDLAGHIPDLEAIKKFTDDTRPDKRARLVDTLLDEPDYVRNLATIWTNLLIGRSSERPVNRAALAKFLRNQFHDNRPWSETVGQLVSAEGTEDENGATNFLLAHLNNEAVPATAITARLFLCQQVQCTQCHAHPQTRTSQDTFWELNSFFQQTEVVEHKQYDPKTGTEVVAHRELVSRPLGGPTFFEDTQGVLKVAYPKYYGTAIAEDEHVNRRQELAKLLTQGERPQIAQAFVNRVWGHFFGKAFTDPIDDMGLHQEVSHPELLAQLSESFVASNYDVKQLIRWVTNSRAYQLASEQHDGNLSDDPGEGVVPLFSRMYVKPLSAEQLFDSLLVATAADRANVSYWEQADTRRDEWLNQLYSLLENEENGESSLFDGSLSQTLLMMNGDLVRHAISGAPGTFLHQVGTSPESEVAKIKQLCRSTLTRDPSPQELTAIRRLLAKSPKTTTPRESDRKVDNSPQLAVNDNLRDVFWAYLNSSEFAMNH